MLNGSTKSSTNGIIYGSKIMAKLSFLQITKGGYRYGKAIKNRLFSVIYENKRDNWNFYVVGVARLELATSTSRT